MNLIDYSIFEKKIVSVGDLASETFNLFVSSYNDSYRVKSVFSATNADRKVWLSHPEYQYEPQELPASDELFAGNPDESAVDFWIRFFRHIDVGNRDLTSVAFDITGMMRPHLMLLPLMLRLEGFNEAVFFYSDPESYASGEGTKFSKGPVDGVRVIPGLEGSHRSGPGITDVLVIGAGYDDVLIRAVAESKQAADHFVVVGLPSLRAHMYQESLLRVAKARQSIHDFRDRTILFAPASDPFTTAQVIGDHVKRLRSMNKADNLYLSPVGPKTQVLGFAWYFLCQERNNATSMVFPFSESYERETSIGLSAIHRFRMELDVIPT